MAEAVETNQEEMIKAAALFRIVYPVFMVEIDQAEATRGSLKEFQLSMAAEHAKNSVRILGWNSRRTLNAIFEAFKEQYLRKGRAAAESWAEETFGCSMSVPINEPEEPAIPDQRIASDREDLERKIETLLRVVQEKEVELLRVYRELSILQDSLSLLNSQERPIEE